MPFSRRNVERCLLSTAALTVIFDLPAKKQRLLYDVNNSHGDVTGNFVCRDYLFLLCRIWWAFRLNWVELAMSC